MDDLITRLPKAELHVHIEGTLEPDMMFRLATRNGLSLPFEDIDQVHAAYRFSDLQSFLDLYYRGCDVLRDESDFMAMTAAYFRRPHADKVTHAAALREAGQATK